MAKRKKNETNHKQEFADSLSPTAFLPNTTKLSEANREVMRKGHKCHCHLGEMGEAKQGIREAAKNPGPGSL